MDLNERQTDALVDLGEIGGRKFIEEETIDELLGLGLVYWRTPGQLDFTPAGEEVYNELTGIAEMALVGSQ